MKTRIATILLVIIIAVIGMFVYSLQQSKKIDTLSDEDFVQAVTRQFPVFLNNDGEPVIRISSVSRHDDGWYLVRIASLKEPENPIPVWLIMSSSDTSDNDLYVIMGPETHFEESELLKYNVPDSIIRELQNDD